MPRRKRGVTRTMGTRSVTVTLQFSLADDRRITERAWDELQDVIDAFVESVAAETIFTAPIQQKVVYNREVEVRPDFYFS